LRKGDCQPSYAPYRTGVLATSQPTKHEQFSGK
jgi:hypothetical protein